MIERVMSVAAAMDWAVGQLDGISDSARLDAAVLLAQVLNKSRTYLLAFPEVVLDAEQSDRFKQAVHRRARGEPVAYIVGAREFWSLNLTVSPDTLIPRPDTEILVSVALALCAVKDACVLDLGTGTGAIAMALASERPLWKVQALDKSAAALTIADFNRQTLGLENIGLYQSDWFSQTGDQYFDLIVSNPPYIAEDDVHLHEGDVAFEPREALVAAEQGYADLLHIIERAPRRLSTGGWLVLEHGYQQAERVRNAMIHHGFSEVHTVADLAGLERVTAGKYCGKVL